MKFLSLFLLSISVFANVRYPMKNIRAARIIEFNMDKEFDGLPIRGGISVNETDKLVEIYLDVAAHCLPGRVCPQYIQKRNYSAEIQRETIGHCGETIIEAKTDKRPVDGSLTEITVVDNSTNTCRYIRAIPSTKIILKRMLPRSTQASVSLMIADKLHQTLY